MPVWKKVTKIIRPVDVGKPLKWSGAKQGTWIVRSPIGKWLHRVEGQLCRMPSYFPNYELAMIPLQQSQIDEFQRTGHISSAITFRTSVKMNKVEVKKYLQTLYGLEISNVHTAVMQGKKYRQLQPPFRHFRKPDWKKVWVYLSPPAKEAELVTAARGLAASGVESGRVGSGALASTSSKAAVEILPEAPAVPAAAAVPASSGSGGLLGWIRKLSASAAEGGRVDETLRGGASAKDANDREARRREVEKSKKY